MFYLILVLFALVGSALVVLTIENLATPVQFMLFTWQSPNLPLGLVVLIAFILGAFLLYVVSALSALRDARERHKLRKRVAELEQQLAALLPAPPQSIVQAPVAPMPMPGVGTPPQK